ncbi:hypothetical protein MBH78_22815 [Oceanimonas sp. NS1]|nr:hypothetical protein [Oceanimonas sp. NS1]
MVNPPTKNKYGYWLSDASFESAEQWLASAKREEGSWWPHWQQWAAPYLGKQVDARAVGNNECPGLMPAPGRYVQQTLPVEE